MNPLNLITDSYERPARLYPALLLIAPIVVTVATIMSENLSVLKSLGATVAGCGGTFLLSQLARDAGKKCTEALFEKWGGIPSVAIFRYRDTRLDAITKMRYHKKLANLVKEANAPSVEDEQADPIAADRVYIAWSNYLRVSTRDTKKYPLLFRENVNYGYRRNVFGLRTVGIIASAVSCVLSAIWLCLLYRSTEKISAEIAGAVVFALVFFLLWVFRFSSSWVRMPADAYAERLAETTDSVGGEATSTKKRK